MKKVLLFLFVLISVHAFSQIRINELMSNNVSFVMDDSYNYSMWVELHNTSTTTSYNQNSFYFTDDLNFPQKWRPIFKLIPAKGYALLYFEREDRTGHASFKLQPEGGTLYMLNLSGSVIDQVAYPSQLRNISYGRNTDGSGEWVYFEQPSPGASNDGKMYSNMRCAKPVFEMKGGFFTGTQYLKFQTPETGDTIYFTTNGAEPSRSSIRYLRGNTITINSTTIVRAKTFSAGKLSSDIVTETFFVNERNFNLPVVSISTTQANLTDNTIGIYVQGTNGITGNGMSSPANWNQDWSRPANFELFDTTKTQQLNQELDIAISGGWTRMNGQKSLKISPKKKFGNNRLYYDFFQATKPNQKYKDIVMRNSGNDFAYSMMRDGFMQSIVMKRMNLDYLAYEPAVCFMNGVYFGIQNLRERSNADFLYSNYGYDEEEVYLLEREQMATEPEYIAFIDYVTKNDVSQPAVYNAICEMMDVDNFISYMISQTFFGNTDWPHNNIKTWKKKEGGKWRWILYDTDFGFNLFDGNLHNFNSITYVLGENPSKSTEAWATLLMRRLILNEAFRNKFIDKYAVQLSSTFQPVRVNQIMDSLAAKISTEIVYHKNKWGSSRAFQSDINTMKTFSANRPNNMYGYLSSRFLSGVTTHNVNISSNIPTARYRMNGELIQDNAIDLRYFRNRTMQLEAEKIRGYKFKQWELVNSATSTLVSYGSTWKYFDGSSMPASNWYTSAYNDVSWKSGAAPLGYGNSQVVTTIGFGNNSSNKYPTSYYRLKANISDLNSKSNFVLNLLVDDGAAVYVNGQEVGRYLLPTGTLAFNTYATFYNNGDYVSFNVPQSYLKEGENLIAVEVHQYNASSSDVLMDLQMTYSSGTVSQTVTQPIYSTVLTANMNLYAVYEESASGDDEFSVVMNEFVSSNNKISDEYGEKDDYIELYNFGEQEVNVAGWYISDTPINPRLTRIPTTDSVATAIPPKGFLVLWADGQTHQGVLHVGFKLGKEGETVTLSREDQYGELHVIDQVSFPEMDQNMSYSRVPDGSDNWVVQVPTWNATNQLFSSVNPVDEIDVQLFPTLVDDYFNVINCAGQNLVIFDLTGKMMHADIIQSDFETVQAGKLPKGMYIVSVGNKAFKIIKQ